MYKEIIYPNRLKLITYKLESSFSANIGVFINAGTRNERYQNHGCAHFLEHMLFKGTKKRTALDIAETIDGIGGIINAYTTHEFTSYYTRTLKEDSCLALDVLFDMLTQSSLDEEDIEKEKKVILEEINMYEDDPGNFVVEEFSKNLFKDSPYGSSILGDKKLVVKLDKKILKQYLESHYRPEKMILVVAGNFDEELLSAIGRTFGSLKPSSAQVEDEGDDGKATPFGIRILERDNVNQIYFAAGFEGVGKSSPHYYHLALLNNIVGASSSSYLFQQLREKLSLCYDIGSFTSAFKNTGEFIINGGANTENFPLALKELQTILARLSADGVKREEFDRSKKQIKSQLVMSFENPQNIMFMIASDIIYFDRFQEIGTIAGEIDNIGYEEFNRFVRAYLEPERLSICLMGPKGSKFLKGVWKGNHEKIKDQNHLGNLQP